MPKSVSDAVAARFSCRAFLETPVPEEDVRGLLETAGQAPSGGNVQPWHVYVTMGEDRDAFLKKVESSMAAHPMGEPDAGQIYPVQLKEPYKSRRYKCGEDLYGAVDIPREDKMGRMMQLVQNFSFFGAPVGLFFALDKTMGRPQWAHLGMYMQTIMLLAEESGLATCAQEAWMLRHETVRAHFEMPEHLDFYCGMALGYKDETAAINQYRTDRAPLQEIVTFKA